MEAPPATKRKREVLSDRDYRLRKERTDELIEGLRNVRERSLSPTEKSLLELKKKEARESKEEGEQSELKRKPVPDDLEPPPLYHLGDDADDPDGDGEIAVGTTGSEGNDQVGEERQSRSDSQAQAECPPGKEEAVMDGMTGLTSTLEEQARAMDLNAGSSTRVILTVRQLRRVMAAKESLFKFGTFVPKSEREADSSPEAPRWRAGKDLEWMRLREQGTFERDWSWARIQVEHPTYKKSDIGFLFYVYDYKFSGEHRVRLVFDGSRQSAETYDETYAPTARQESVRIFHVVCVEESYGLGQYDVPQAFLKAFIDFDIFVYPPRGQAEFSGQLLKIRRALYGGKQSAYLWYTLMNEFILELGFTASALDKCLYRRSDAILILYCDDLRIGASDGVLASLHSSFYERFGITTAPGNRFLGMDTCYQRKQGLMKLSMESYISTTMDRFKDFDVSQGYPYREVVGCLL
jgi:hypothetical protein